ncbi:TerB family tellurite resistance protein [Sinimarinibacterium flocculans]|uniref:Putative tellurite resistance protein B-like protein n=1 Tax=Sinimarinibacterium flocculans TaxID=985250 RepID=A0A318EE12_9GAMM|nr:TerB family tellurite resistance protein [Sinimarinibacterium flocculans]PXV71009.1 putative tellurite resistance protein B-like protein [Sinimarinibacterium flocculans]
MLDKLARMLRGANGASAGEEPVHRHLAMAVLLVETARADFADQGEERDVMRRALVDALGLNPDEAAELVDSAFSHSREAVSLHGFLDTLNRELDADGKRQLLEWLWRVAFADGRVDPQEEARVRQLAELLFLPHSEFVRMRLKVEAEQAAREQD